MKSCVSGPETVTESKWSLRALRAAKVVAVMMVVGAAPARAYRPFTGTDAGIAELHKLEVEMEPLGYLRTGDERQIVGPSLVVTYGAGSGYEFGAGARRLLLMSPDAEGVKPRIDDIELTAGKLLKTGSVQDKRGLSAVVEGALLIPSSSRGKLGIGVLFAASRVWEDIALHLNVGVSRTREGEAGRSAGLIAEGPDRWGVRPVAEATLQREGEDSPLRSLLLGLIWQTRSGLAMDFACITGYADERQVEFRSGITWNRHVSGPRVNLP